MSTKISMTERRKIAREQLRRVGVTMRWTPEHDEYRVDFLNARSDDGTAYYTPDLDDALATGLHMAEHRRYGARLAPDASRIIPALCTHEWVYTGSAYGGCDDRWHGEGRCYCALCGADGDG